MTYTLQLKMSTRNGIRYQPFPPHRSKLRKADGDLMEEVIRRPSFQLPHLPDDVMPFYQPFPPPPPSALIVQEGIRYPQDRKGRSVRVAMYNKPCDRESVWFSCAELHTKTQTLSSSDELGLSKTHPIIELWSSVRDAKFAGQMYALFPHPNIKDEMYIFAGTATAKIDIAHRTVDSEGPGKTIDRWPSLKTAGFTWVDAVLLDPANQNRAWFFKGRDFVTVGWEPGVVNDRLLDGPRPFSEGWKSLKAAGFGYVTMFVSNPQFPDQPWVFSGDYYMRISVSADSILFGPALIPDPDLDSEN